MKTYEKIEVEIKYLDKIDTLKISFDTPFVPGEEVDEDGNLA